MLQLCCQDIDIDKSKIGLKGSPTQAGEIYIPDISRKGEEITGSPKEIVDELIKRLRVAGVNFAERGEVS